MHARFTFLLCGLLGAILAFSQPNATVTKRSIPKQGSVQPTAIQEDWSPSLQSLEMPVPGSEWEEMMRIKREVRERFPLRAGRSKKSRVDTPAPAFIQGRSFEGNLFDWGVPNDNHVAVSNDDYLISVINSTIRAYDLKEDTILIDDLSLHAFQDDSLNLPDSKYDPKVTYDPNANKFILLFLNGYNSNTSRIVMAFSSSSDPTQPWNLYALPGNPLQDTTWSDYPAIALNEHEAFLTINQLKDGESWQEGFTQSLIWQVDKSSGYRGADSLRTQLWSNIRYSDRYKRYLHPVQHGIRPQGTDLYFLSNRNFAVQNDSIWLLHLSDTMNGNPQLKLQLYHTDPPYGMPPNGRQANNHKLATNDARMLDAIIVNNQIQYVHNTVDTITGLAAVYHGIIPKIALPDSIPPNINPPDSIVNGHIIGSSTLDYGYPNIAFTGNAACEDEAIITFNHTSPSANPGCSGVYFSNKHQYSNRVTLKNGYAYIDHLGDTIERWGDYSGLQRVYDEPGKVWYAGMWGDSFNNQSTWLGKLTSPDSGAVLVTHISDSSNQGSYNRCEGFLKAEVVGGHPPYQYEWNDQHRQTDSIATHLCSGTYTVTVTDRYDCTFTATTTIRDPVSSPALFPNPTQNQTTVHFTVNQSMEVNVTLWDLQGRLVKRLLSAEAKPGKNAFSFSAKPLSKGPYIIKIESPQKTLLTRQFIKM